MDMNGYQWTVLFAAWLGWGFDVFDGLLFNYVAPNCVPTLLHLPIGSPEAAKASLFWNGLLSSLLLLGWAAGGILFGQVADRLGRTRTLMLTMLVYALGTTLCAAAPNMWTLVIFRIVASLGIGGEWAAGAAMVAEVVPDKRRVEAGALLYTSAPAGLFLATFVNYQIAGVWFKGSPETSWRYVFLCGLIPAVVAFVVRIFVREPERWKQAARDSAPPRLRELFRPGIAQVHAQRRLDGGHRAHHLVELQRLHPAGVDRAGARPGAHRRPGSPGHAGAGRELEVDRDQHVQLGRPDRHAAHDPGGEDHGAAPDVRASTTCCRASPCWRRSAWTCRPRRGCACTS